MNNGNSILRGFRRLGYLWRKSVSEGIEKNISLEQKVNRYLVSRYKVRFKLLSVKDNPNSKDDYTFFFITEDGIKFEVHCYKMSISFSGMFSDDSQWQVIDNLLSRVFETRLKEYAVLDITYCSLKESVEEVVQVCRKARELFDTYAYDSLPGDVSITITRGNNVKKLHFLSSSAERDIRVHLVSEFY